MTPNRIKMEHKITIIIIRIKIQIVILKMTMSIMGNTKLKDQTIQILKANTHLQTLQIIMEENRTILIITTIIINQTVIYLAMEQIKDKILIQHHTKPKDLNLVILMIMVTIITLMRVVIHKL